jgi:hypothetical protein
MRPRLSLTLSLRWLAFKLLRILLPKDRTGLFVIPLFLLVAGAATAMIPTTRPARWLRVSGLILLLLGAIYFAGCLRLRYFKEWKYDADVKAAYATLQYLNRNEGGTAICTDWKYLAALNFHRAYFHDGRIPPFKEEDAHTPGKQAYVLYLPFEDQFIKQQGLKVVYQEEFSEIVGGNQAIVRGTVYATFCTLPFLMHDVQTRIRLFAPFTTARTL